jgi:single-stranded-DNA-specific exonuclease
VLDRLEAGKNTLAILGTGRGKSLCFQYPAAVRALEDGHKTVVLYPLRALANDQYEALITRLSPLGVRIFRANGSIDADARADLMKALASGEWDIICSTPEFFTYHLSRFQTVSRPNLIVVDEAHHLFQSKHRTAYGRVRDAIQALGLPQVLALTATADDEVFEHIVKTLDIEGWVIDPTVRANLKMVDVRGTFNKTKYLQDNLGGDSGKAIIYCMSRSEATKIAERLRPSVPAIAFYHAGVPTEERTEIERMFRQNQLRVVVATSAFGEGIDLPDVRDVFLYHMNFDFTEFNQQSGRAGRDGRLARIHMLFGEKDRRINDFIIEKAAPTIHTLRTVYTELTKIAAGSEIRMTYVNIADTLQIDKVDARTVSAAVRIFADCGLLDLGDDDDGRFIRIRQNPPKVDLTTNAQFAEGEAERESFSKFCEVVLNTPPELLENLINRPIFPQSIPLRS